MANEARFKAAYPYQKDVTSPVPTVILERDGTRVGFAVNGGDAARLRSALPR